MNCTVCNSSDTTVKFVKNGFEIIHCLRCDHLFTGTLAGPEEVNKIYSDDYFFKGGAGYDDYTLEKNILIKRGEYYAKKINRFIKSGKLLDVGTAAGFILKGFENKGWSGVGVEPNRSMVEYGRKYLGVNITYGTMEAVDLEDSFDLVVLIQVLAHLYDIHAALKRIFKYLKPEGYVLVETWNINSLTAKIFGKNWHEYSPPGILNYFSKKSLNRLLEQYGFSKVAQGVPKKRIHSRHAKSLIKHTLEESKGLRWAIPLTKLIPGNMIIPYPSEDLFWTLYKKPDSIKCL